MEWWGRVGFGVGWAVRGEGKGSQTAAEAEATSAAGDLPPKSRAGALCASQARRPPATPLTPPPHTHTFNALMKSAVLLAISGTDSGTIPSDESLADAPARMWSNMMTSRSAALDCRIWGAGGRLGLCRAHLKSCRRDSSSSSAAACCFCCCLHQVHGKEGQGFAFRL